MSAPKDAFQIVAAPTSGWCEPDTGVCHIDSTEDASITDVTAGDTEVDATSGTAER